MTHTPFADDDDDLLKLDKTKTSSNTFFFRSSITNDLIFFLFS